MSSFSIFSYDENFIIFDSGIKTQSIDFREDTIYKDDVPADSGTAGGNQMLLETEPLITKTPLYLEIADIQYENDNFDMTPLEYYVHIYDSEDDYPPGTPPANTFYIKNLPDVFGIRFQKPPEMITDPANIFANYTNGYAGEDITDKQITINISDRTSTGIYNLQQKASDCYDMIISNMDDRGGKQGIFNDNVFIFDDCSYSLQAGFPTMTMSIFGGAYFLLINAYVNIYVSQTVPLVSSSNTIVFTFLPLYEE